MEVLQLFDGAFASFAHHYDDTASEAVAFVLRMRIFLYLNIELFDNLDIIVH